MKTKQRKRLEAAGLAVSETTERPALSPEEVTIVEMRLALSRTLRARRSKAGLTQTALAELLGSSQSRVAKLEAGDPSVSLDLLIRALLGMGASRKKVARALGRNPK